MKKLAIFTSIFALSLVVGIVYAGMSGAIPGFTALQFIHSGVISNVTDSLPLPVNATFSGGSVTIANPLGQLTMANSVAVAIASDQTTLKVSQQGKTPVNQIRIDYSVNNDISASYTQILASTAGASTSLTIFDSGGYSFILGTGSSGSEVPLLDIPPGGLNGPIPVTIASGTRLSMKAIGAATVNIGELIINTLN